jgi:hypothetical protein
MYNTNMINLRFSKYLTLFFVISFLVLSPVFVFAQGQTSCTPGQLCNPIKVGSLPELIKKILEGVIKIGIPVIALAIIYSGFLFVFARGNSEKLKTAKKSITYTLIGAAVLLGSWAIAQIISDTVIELGK